VTEKTARKFLNDTSKYFYHEKAKGYLEAIEKIKPLLKLLDIGDHDPTNHAIMNGDCWNCKRIKVLKQWGKEK